MIGIVLLVLANPLSNPCCGTTVGEEKVSYIFKLNAQRRRFGDVFDAVAAAALVIAADGALSDDDQTQIVVAALLGSPDNTINDMTMLVTTLADAVSGGERAAIVKMIEGGRPRASDRTWLVAGKTVEIVRRVKGIDESNIDRVVEIINAIGEHPLFLGFPS